MEQLFRGGIGPGVCSHSSRAELARCSPRSLSRVVHQLVLSARPFQQGCGRASIPGLSGRARSGQKLM